MVNILCSVNLNIYSLHKSKKMLVHYYFLQGMSCILCPVKRKCNKNLWVIEGSCERVKFSKLRLWRQQATLVHLSTVHCPLWYCGTVAWIFFRRLAAIYYYWSTTKMASQRYNLHCRVFRASPYLLKQVRGPGILTKL